MTGMYVKSVSVILRHLSRLKTHHQLKKMVYTRRGMYEEEEDRVLEFLNKCDSITLRKLKHKHSIINHENIMKRKILPIRYTDLDRLYQFKTGIIPNKVPAISDSIIELKEREETFLGIGSLNPQLKNEDAKNLDEIVVIDIDINEIAWLVAKRDRTIVKLQHESLFREVKYNYTHCHELLWKRLTDIVTKIPESPMYCVCGPKADKSQWRSRYRTSVFSLFVLLLNMRSQQQLEGWVKQEDGSYQLVSDVIGNRVYILDYRDTVHEYYSPDIYNKSISFSQLLLMRDSPVEGLKYSYEIEKHLTKGRGCVQLTKCVLIADIVCKSLRKKVKRFPCMYD